MPELPEVETTRRGLAPHCVGAVITHVAVRETRLRWPVPASLAERLTGARLQHLDRRGKYLIMRFDSGRSLILHLGMSGYIRVVSPTATPRKHDHIDLMFDNDRCLRFHDPRRFGSVHLTEGPAESHSLLSSLGPEPLGEAFDGGYLHARAGNRRLAVKSFIMDSQVVVGVGNIYATEALYRAGIHPGRGAGRISRQRFDRLAATIQDVLSEAIDAGGTTLRDFARSDGQPGYFQQALHAYGHGGKPCARCGRTMRSVRLAQRATVYCPGCQR
ncbi:bifunctional DNA-formamidopyrimidine glycosylase/DNA-(apurinic or apyrimidinic site) lyase [Spiribacter vilamensis]|uniref:Formamidopyrimidine-DNA glycosylase n=1 Tax=Spiribacter vilamensis TaxID=531306 RepID=A0A4Q8D222_9GAMM|nr:bifunctional DNA-formamidopyrimidine glycosylase/DNA-(apurinic or apyrimidinic site) lyase [Spiribacter vilamensis]RZU99393.1 DNA-(apurinic or apyrimidinic site) lyase [Spiribacter vilamensis]TVO61630.1 bifunctional DNA-formamidopyrimidine glycosylase/DNA-(apurinic or apyrimidinic site) lyase [Spiribacter vilamensis]